MAGTDLTILRGVVEDGAGRSGAMMTIGPDAHFYELYFGKLAPGTFNVRLRTPHLLTPDMPAAHTTDGRVLYVQRCTVENLAGFIVQLGGQLQPESLLHVVSVFPLRRFLRLETGSDVNVKVAAMMVPSDDVGRQ